MTTVVGIAATVVVGCMFLWPAAAARPLIAVLRGYQRWVSPALPPTCRFHPTCSAYAIEALRTHGAARGGWLTTRRLLRCAPWHPGGVDPVPPRPADRPRRTGTDRTAGSTRGGEADRTAANHEEQAPC